MQHLVIEYCDPNDQSDTVTLRYRLRDHSVVHKWIGRVEQAQAKYHIDNPGRFYGFGSIEQQTAYALEQMNLCIDTINRYQPIVVRRLANIRDQDTLNYLHNIFEQYHGLLDQQNTLYWNNAPDDVKIALADLNLLVHRCESIARGAQPRHVVTWYGLPKTETLADEDYQLFESNINFGTVYLNYVEIGKTLEDLAADNDRYISDEAFQPFRHYSADFNVKFWTRQDNQNDSIIKEYYNKNSEFFAGKNLLWGDPKLAIGAIPLADLDDDPALVEQLSTRQWVKSVNFI
jgi:hypothetical protein